MDKAASLPFKLTDQVSVSGTYTSSVSGIIYRDSVGYQVNLNSGAPTGYVQIDVCSDYNPGLPQSGPGSLNNGTWTTVASVSVTSTSFPVTFQLNQLASAFSRLQMVTSSGTAVITTYFTAKSLG